MQIKLDYSVFLIFLLLACDTFCVTYLITDDIVLICLNVNDSLSFFALANPSKGVMSYPLPL